MDNEYHYERCEVYEHIKTCDCNRCEKVYCNIQNEHLEDICLEGCLDFKLAEEV